MALEAVDRRALLGASREDLIRLAKELYALEEHAARVGPQTDDELHALVKKHYGINIPRTAVTPGFDAPFDFFSDAFFQRETSQFVIACREGAKTFLVAMIHALFARYYPGYEGISAGAVENQSKRAYEALKNLNRMWGEEMIESTLQSETTWKTGSKVHILPGTVSALNGPHSNILHRDEVELYRLDAFEEGSNITKSGTMRDGQNIKAHDILTSTRKRARGLVQKILERCEEADRLGVRPPYKIYKWGVAETVKRVDNCRYHMPAGTPDNELCSCNRILNGKWENGESRTLESVCQGRFGVSDGWRPLDPDIIKKFSENNRATWEAQQECLKPASEGLILPNFTVETHGIRDYMPDPENGPIFQGIDFGGCYDAETEVLTRRGWIAWPDVVADDEFASLDPETELVEFQRATEIIDKPYHGYMDRWENKSIDLLVTSDHNMFVSPLNRKRGAWRLAPSLFVSPTSRMTQTSDGLLESHDGDFVLPSFTNGKGQVALERKIPGEAWAAFLGLWMAEGHTDYGRSESGETRTTGRAGITHYNKNNIDELLEKIAWYLNHFRIGCDYDAKRGQLIINDGQVCDHLRQFGKASEKFLPDYVKQWSPRLLGIFLDWYERGDGCRGRIYTSSKRMADDLQEIAMYAGYSAYVASRPAKDSVIDGREIVGNYPQYVVGLRRGQNKPTVWNKSWQSPTRITITPEEWGHQRVYCAVLPKHHTLYVRRNGKPVWCGNTNPHAANWYQWTEREVLAKDFFGNDFMIPVNCAVAFDEVYIAEVGNMVLAQMIVNVETSWKLKFKYFTVSERYADVASKAARIDLRNFDPPLPTIWRVTREVDEHIKICQDWVNNRQLFVDVGRCEMFIEEAVAWQYDPQTGKQIDDYNHAMSAFRYFAANWQRKLQIKNRVGANNDLAAASDRTASTPGSTDRLGLESVPDTGPSSSSWSELPPGIPLHRHESAGDNGRVW